MPSSLGQRISGLRTARGWTQSELARRLKVTKANIGHYEHDRRFPRRAVLIRIARLLETELGTLYQETVGQVAGRAA